MIVKMNEARCNKCGKKLDEFDVNGDYTLHKKIGYGSKHDGEDLNLTLCSDCLDELIDSCKIPPVDKI